MVRTESAGSAHAWGTDSRDCGYLKVIVVDHTQVFNYETEKNCRFDRKPRDRALGELSLGYLQSMQKVRHLEIEVWHLGR